MKIYRDKCWGLEIMEVPEGTNVFDFILKRRKELEGKFPAMFEINFLSSDIETCYDFNDKDSLASFRQLCNSSRCPFLEMGLYNQLGRNNERLFGIKICDPERIISGVFDIDFSYKTITYNPDFPNLSDERDYIKVDVADNSTYFTTMTFKEIIEPLIEEAENFFITEGSNPKFPSFKKRKSSKEEIYLIIGSKPIPKALKKTQP